MSKPKERRSFLCELRRYLKVKRAKVYSLVIDLYIFHIPATKITTDRRLYYIRHTVERVIERDKLEDATGHSAQAGQDGAQHFAFVT